MLSLNKDFSLNSKTKLLSLRNNILIEVCVVHDLHEEYNAHNVQILNIFNFPAIFTFPHPLHIKHKINGNFLQHSKLKFLF